MLSCRRAAAVAGSLVAVSLAADSASAQRASAAPAPVRIEIVAGPPDGSSPAAGWIGLKFVVEEGWHIYWQNPGDSGGPPEVSWQLPQGFSAGPLQWPVPERITLESLVNYGYHGEVVLPARLRGPAGGGPARPFTVRAQAKWLACRDACIPGKGEASLVVPAGPGDSRAAESIRRALAQVPRPAPRTWRLSGTVEADAFRVAIETGEKETKAEFFPLVPGQVASAPPSTASPTARGLDLVLRKSDYLNSIPASLRGVVVLSGGRAHEIDVPLAPAKR